MKRREFITLLGGGTAWPIAARAQQPVVPVIGYLNSGSPENSPRSMAAFRRGLNEAGLIERRDVAFEYRWADNHYDRLPALAAELVRVPAAVLVANGVTAAVAAAPALRSRSSSTIRRT